MPGIAKSERRCPFRQQKRQPPKKLPKMILVRFRNSLILSFDMDLGFQVSAKRFSATSIDGLAKSRHTRESGYPGFCNSQKFLDSRLRGNDGIRAFRLIASASSIAGSVCGNPDIKKHGLTMLDCSSSKT
jgi:hypothetical protein